MIEYFKLFRVVTFPKWEWDFRFVRYSYSGNDGRHVTDWILHLGSLWIVKDRIA